MTVEPKYGKYDIEEQDAITDIELHPVIKSNWKSLGARDYWGESLSAFVPLIPDFMQAVIENEDHPRDAFILDTTERAHDAFTNRVSGTNMAILRNPEDRENRPYRILTDYVNAVSMLDGKPSEHYDVVAKDKETANRINKLLYRSVEDDPDDFAELAEIFGWPDCCIEFHKQSIERGHRDPLYEVACNTESSTAVEDDPQHVHVEFPDPFLNPFWRYHGFRFAYHVPCSFECDASGRLARTNYEIYKEVAGEEDAHHIEKVLAWLEQPMYWSGYHALTHIKNAYGIGTYHTDNNWEEKQIIWVQEHRKKPELEVNHPTTALEPINPEHSAL